MVGGTSQKNSCIDELISNINYSILVSQLIKSKCLLARGGMNGEYHKFYVISLAPQDPPWYAPVQGRSKITCHVHIPLNLELPHQHSFGSLKSKIKLRRRILIPESSENILSSR